MSNADLTQEDEIAEVARQIERYLDAHPNAADSAEGILRWWLTRQRYEESVGKVLQALEQLLQQGTVCKRVLQDGQVLYTGGKHSPADMETTR